MTRDYAKSNRTNTNKRKTLLVLATGVLGLAIIIPSSFFALKYLKGTHKPKTLIKSSILKKPTTPVNTPKPTVQAKNQFDFYKMLPSIKVKVAKPPAAGQMPIPAGNAPYYVIQIATSSNLNAAKNLVEQLGVIGVNAYTQPHKKANGSASYTIITGPYASKDASNSDQALLDANHYQHLLRRVTPNT